MPLFALFLITVYYLLLKVTPLPSFLKKDEDPRGKIQLIVTNTISFAHALLMFLYAAEYLWRTDLWQELDEATISKN